MLMKKSVYAVKLVQKKIIIIMQKGDLSFVEKKMCTISVP